MSEEENQDQEEKEYASIEDCMAPTDEDGEVIPVEKTIDGVGMCKFLPITWEEGRDFFEGIGDEDGNTKRLEPRHVASLFREFYIKPDFKGNNIHAKELQENFYFVSAANLLTELMRHSGADVDVEMNPDMSAEISKGKKNG